MECRANVNGVEGVEGCPFRGRAGSGFVGEPVPLLCPDALDASL